MARVIKKKTINEDLLFSDDFDEGTLDQIEKSLGPGLSDGEAPDSGPDRQDIGGSKQWREQLVELDDGPDLADPDQRTAASPKGEDSKQESEPEIASSLQRQVSNRMSSWRRIMLFSGVFALLMLTAGAAYLLWPNAEYPSAEKSVAPGPMVAPKHEREVSFLILASSSERSDLLKLDLEFAFMSLDGYEKFMDNQIFYHDLIYNHLISQKPPDNSDQNWEKILEEGLLESLKRQCPEIRLNLIRVKTFHRL